MFCRSPKPVFMLAILPVGFRGEPSSWDDRASRWRPVPIMINVPTCTRLPRLGAGVATRRLAQFFEGNGLCPLHPKANAIAGGSNPVVREAHPP